MAHKTRSAHYPRSIDSKSVTRPFWGAAAQRSIFMGKRSVYNLPGLREGAAAPDLVKSGNMFFTSGIGGVDLKTGELPDDPAKQFLNAWHNLATLVKGAGLSTDNIGLVTNFIDSQDYRAHINTGWLELFPDKPNRPARNTTSYPMPERVG